MEPVPLDAALVSRFQGQTMAIVGYESDQVMIDKVIPKAGMIKGYKMSR